MKIFVILLAQYFYLPYICIALEQLIELWCNGNTADFGSVVQGSNPCSSTLQVVVERSLMRKTIG